MMTVHKLSHGDGHTYYTHEVATGDALRSNDREIGDYYTVEGMPPGQWVGSSIHELGVSGNVTEAQMEMLFSGKAKPLTPEMYTEALEAAGVAGEFARIRVMEEERVKYAEENWRIIHEVRKGTPEQRIGRMIGLSREAVNKRKLKMMKLNTVEPYSGKVPSLAEAKESIIATYTMTPAQHRAAEAKAEEAKEKAKLKWIKEHDFGNRDHSYPTANKDFLKAVQKKLDKHNSFGKAEPSKAEMRAYRLEVAAKMFREENGYNPENEELVRYMQRLEKPAQQSIAGYDLVFSPTKSVSIAWGLGNENLRKGIEKAHEAAIADVITYLEENALYTRRGQGGVEQIDVDGGIIGTKFRHYDSREGDPNIHDHLVIVNRVKGADGRWSAIDGRNIYGYGVSASELYNTKIAQYIHQNLGLEFVKVPRKGKFIYELAGFEDKAIQAFSSRRASINKEYKKVHAQFVKDHGYEPNERQVKQLYQQVTLSTRPQKLEAKSLKDLNDLWREKAASLKDVYLPTGDELELHLRNSSTKQAEKVVAGKSEALTTSPLEHAEKIIGRLENTRSMWSDRHIEAEAHRYFRELTNGSFIDDDIFHNTIKSVKNISLSMRAEHTMDVPEEKFRKDGTSVYTRAGSQLYTTHRIIEGEQNLLSAARNDATAPAQKATFEEQLKAHRKTSQVSEAQENMARAFATSPKRLVVGIGPAGAGKTTSTVLTVKTVKAQGRKVIGLAPTAAAAAVMSQELGIEATTLDRFLHETDKTKHTLTHGDVLLVDEIGMVSTPKLNELLTHSYNSGAVIRGMGDTRQLSAVGAGGALRLIEREVGAVYLEDVFRFRNEDGSTNIEEANASMLLREPAATGADKPFAWYIENNRVMAGESEAMLSKVFDAWSADTAAGKKSLMLAANNQAVQELNRRAQIQAIAQGKVVENKWGISLHDSTTAYKGEIVVTRENDRRNQVRGGKDFVKNGDLWQVLSTRKDGSMVVKNLKHGGKTVLSAHYVAKNVELGYASTIARSQGATVDTVHAYVDKSTDRAGAYVGLTRGRYSNRIYVATDAENNRDAVLEAITNNYDKNLSVHEEVERLRAETRDIATRVSIYNNLAEHSMKQSYATMLRQEVGDTLAEKMINAGAYGALCYELDEVYRAGFDPRDAVRQAFPTRGFEDAHDAAAVMQWRVKQVREHNEALLEERMARPLGGYSDATLAKMIARAEANLPKKPDSANLEDANWADRPYALVKTEELREMRMKTFALLRSREDAKDPYIDDLRQNAYAMDNEWVRRAQMGPEQKAVEQFVRGEKRRDHLFTIVKALKSEQRLRRTALKTVEDAEYKTPAKDAVRAGVSNHTVDPYWATNPMVKPENKALLASHRKQIGQLIELRGKQLADERPEWVKSLGEVPAYPRAAKRWYRIAGEIEAYRNQYKVPAGEVVAIPKKYQESERGQYLQAQMVAMHKSSRLSSTLLSAEESARIAQRAEHLQETRENRSEVEYVLDVQNRDEKVAYLQEQVSSFDEQLANLSTQSDEVARKTRELKQLVEELTPLHQQYRVELLKAQSDVFFDAKKAYRPVKEAKAALEGASFFSRAKAARQVDEATAKFAASYGGFTTLEEVEAQWVPAQGIVREAKERFELNQAALAQAKEQLEQLEQQGQDVKRKMMKARSSRKDAQVKLGKLQETVQARQHRSRQIAVALDAQAKRESAADRLNRQQVVGSQRGTTR
ncbi:MobF family relaxase [Rothia nasimurium]|uniref:MobF family relaxase n=1 Tax=Rothia nasimurium TaxID=85336 RepID=UPI001F48D975|nr:MobF family relaxase [Rothia nasimurium]